MTKINRNELGKGLRALLNQQEQDSVPARESTKKEDQQSMFIPIEQIEPNPLQPRTQFDKEELEELSQSIMTYGLIQPITVRKLADKQYQIISGERRWRASKLAKLQVIPAFVREANDQTMLEMALVENIQRSDLNPLEVAISYQRLIDECGLTHHILSDRVGKKRSTITNYIRLLKLVPEIQKAIKNELISMGHARAMAALTDATLQLTALKMTIEKELSVRRTEELVRHLQNPQQRPSITAVKETLPVSFQGIQKRLSNRFESNIQIQVNASGKGRIAIPFHSIDEFNRILDLLEENG